MIDQRDDDRTVRAAFDALRRETDAAVAPFHAPRPTPARHAMAWHVRPLLATGIVAVVLAGLVIERRAMERRAIVEPFLTSTTWEAPTDFLLVTPGQDLLSAVPTIGRTTNDSGLNDSTGGVPQ